MSEQLPANLLKALRADLEQAIAGFKAYEVPQVCTRLGLPEGSEDEAFQSKAVYARKRISGLSSEEVQKCAEQLHKEVGDYALGETLSKVQDLIANAVSPLTRRRLMKLFELGPFATEVDDMEFLRSVWPLSTMPAPYGFTSYYACLEEYLVQHTVRNDDLTQKDILDCLGLFDGSNANLFKFLSAITSAEFQNERRQAELAEAIDQLIRHDGYWLKEVGKVSGSPIFEVVDAQVGSPSDTRNSESIQKFEQSQIGPRWQLALESRADNPERAITLARTLLEDVCKWILHEAQTLEECDGWDERDDLPALYKKTAKVLNLAPDDHTEQLFKQILSGCQLVVSSLGALRNKLGDAHSIGPKRIRPAARHAELAVNLAGTMATFLIETWAANSKKT